MSDDARISETLHLHHNIGTVLRDFSVDDRPIIRRLEGLLKKHNNARYAVIFTETCIKENLLPKFTNIRLYDQAVQHDEHTLAFRRDLLKEENRKKERLLEEISKKLKDVSKRLVSIIHVKYKILSYYFGDINTDYCIKLLCLHRHTVNTGGCYTLQNYIAVESAINSDQCP